MVWVEGEISNLVIENGTPGYVLSEPMHKLGWKASDTRGLSFSGCRRSSSRASRVAS